MGVVPSKTEVYLPSETIRVCYPDRCFCNGRHRTPRCVCPERGDDGRMRYRDWVDMMDEFVRKGNGWPLAWKDPSQWTGKDYDSIAEIFRECERRRGGGGGMGMGMNMGGGPPPPPYDGFGGFGVGAGGPPPFAGRAEFERMRQYVEQMRQQFETRDGLLFGTEQEQWKERYQQNMMKMMQEILPQMFRQQGMGMGAAMPFGGMGGFGGGMPAMQQAAMYPGAGMGFMGGMQGAMPNMAQGQWPAGGPPAYNTGWDPDQQFDVRPPPRRRGGLRQGTKWRGWADAFDDDDEDDPDFPPKRPLSKHGIRRPRRYDDNHWDGRVPDVSPEGGNIEREESLPNRQPYGRATPYPRRETTTYYGQKHGTARPSTPPLQTGRPPEQVHSPMPMRPQYSSTQPVYEYLSARFTTTHGNSARARNPSSSPQVHFADHSEEIPPLDGMDTRPPSRTGNITPRSALRNARSAEEARTGYSGERGYYGGKEDDGSI